MVPFFDNRADKIWQVHARERLVNICIHPSANSIKVKRVVRLETTVCFRITRWMNNQIKSPKKSYFPKTRESDDKNAVAIVKTVSQLGCASQDSDALVSQGRQSRRNTMQKVLVSIRKARFTLSTLRQASIREKKGPSLWKIQVKSPHQGSPHAMKFEDPERQRRCVRSKAWNLAKNIFKLKENDNATFYSPAKKWVIPVTSIKEPEER